MRFEFALARRYLKAPSAGSAKITAYLAVAGIAIGVAAMIFAFALSRGFREEVQAKLLANTPHISISKTDGSDFADAARVKAELSNIAGVKTVRATAYRNALMSVNGASVYTVLRAAEEIQPESKDGCAAAAVGSKLAEKAGLKIGDTARIVLSAETEAPRSMCVFVEDVFTTGLLEYDSTRIDIALQALTDVSPSALEVSVSDIYGSKQIADAIRQKLGAEYSVVDWQEANKPFFAAMDFERRVVLIVISLVIVLSAVNITFTLALGVAQRRLDIAIMRTAGASAAKIVKLFLFEGVLLGSIGVAAGVVIGLAACYISNSFHLISLPAEIYALNTVTLKLTIEDVLLIVAFTFVVVTLATIQPALTAARTRPWENLRR